MSSAEQLERLVGISQLVGLLRSVLRPNARIFSHGKLGPLSVNLVGAPDNPTSVLQLSPTLCYNAYQFLSSAVEWSALDDAGN
jgi:hypothetical protein